MVDLAERIKSRLPKELPQTGNKGITLQAVAENIKMAAVWKKNWTHL